MKKSEFDREWIIANALEEIENYEAGVLTLRALHYRLVGRGMTNDTNHYKKVVSAMKVARWDGRVAFETFSDHDRQVLGWTAYSPTTVEDAVRSGKEQIQAWMRSYSKNLWENQNTYIEVWIEKKALQGVFQPVCRDMSVGLAPCKGYPSLTFLNDASKRFKSAEYSGKEIKIIYFGDYDPSGEDIPRSVRENLMRLGVDVEVDRRLLLHDQVVAWKLPPAPAKKTDSRTAKWDGLGQVELDAVEPSKIQRILRKAIESHIDEDLKAELDEIEEVERVEFREQMSEYAKSL